MKRLTTALAASLAALAVSAGSAFAAGPPVQSATQSSGTDQAAIAASSATQVNPSNQSISVRVLSPGNDGSTTQSNSASSQANAANTAGTSQNATQTQGGGCGCQSSPLQQLEQAASTGQLGGMLSAAQQLAGSNTAAPSSVGQSGSSCGCSAPQSGPAAPSGNAAPSAQSNAAAPSTDSPAAVPSGSNQSNSAASTGSATNAAPTTQNASQTQGGDGVQSSQQNAQTDQAALAQSSAQQIDPSNSNISVRVLSPGSDGNVTQSNNATSTANASNTGSTTQSGKQVQGGPGSGVQSATQNAETKQLAGAASSAEQDHPSNSNISVRVLSPGSDGSVTQSNTDTSTATATNTAPVSQTATQDPSGPAGPTCGCDGSGSDVQALAQQSKVDQIGGAESSTDQVGALNSNDPVRVWSFGGGGNVTQSNTDTSTATASNTAPISQTGSQLVSGSPCGCGGSEPSVQALGQDSVVGQLSGAASSAQQVGATNQADPARIWSDGNDGNVTQSNAASSTASAANTGTTTQLGNQSLSGSGVQALAQKAATLQGAFAASSATQLPGERTCGCEGSSGSFGNEAGPIRIGSDGSGGDVTQSNSVSSTASAPNQATTTQGAWQTKSGSPCGCGGLGVQALGQEAFTAQLSKALSSAWQIGVKNASDPVRVWSFGSGGSTSQANGASSQASAPNLAGAGQNASQAMIGGPIVI